MSWFPKLLRKTVIPKQIGVHRKGRKSGNMAAYIPDRGDVIWINFDPQAGREQRGRRPAVVLSPRNYNKPSGLMLCCPVTSRAKGYPFEVILPDGAPVKGVVLVDQLRNMDWHSRQASLIGFLDGETVIEIMERLRPLVASENE
jgi:mRNA interferase MazF